MFLIKRASFDGGDPEYKELRRFFASRGDTNNLAAIRNRVGDAHGQGRRPVKPKSRHAELAVNLAGTMASFLVSTWMDRKAGTS
jgi:hypothetical protein